MYENVNYEQTPFENLIKNSTKTFKKLLKVIKMS